LSLRATPLVPFQSLFITGIQRHIGLVVGGIAKASELASGTTRFLLSMAEL
jgi:hypothetical protein